MLYHKEEAIPGVGQAYGRVYLIPAVGVVPSPLFCGRRGAVPGTQLVEDGPQRLPVRRERILDAGRQLGKGLAMHNAIFF